MPRKIPRLLWAALPMAYPLYFYGLTAAGALGPDEPRYASIGRAMARTGDWITPRLWGQPWFEKPALLYWMTGVAFKLGLSDDLAPRLPVALLSVAFLAFYWWILQREFGCAMAWMATLILSTSAGWLAFSGAGVTDLPLSATFSAAMLLAIPWIGRRETRHLPLAAALLGAAVLAKSLVPIVLAAPLMLGWRGFRDFLHPRVWAPFLAVALPWYALCYLRNGSAFPHELFVVQQFGRFTSDALKHVQPWYYYFPNLLWMLLPWTVLAPLAFFSSRRGDRRRTFLLLWVLWGLLFFSVSPNKLPGYVLPLLPAIAALAALGLEQVEKAWLWLAGAAALMVAYPVGAAIASGVIFNGFTHTSWPQWQWWWLAPLALIVPVWILEARGRRLGAVFCLAAGATAGIVYVKSAALGEMDRRNSARTLWLQISPIAETVCVGEIQRAWEYGLNYYADRPLPKCADQPKPNQILQNPGEPPRLSAAH